MLQNERVMSNNQSQSYIGANRKGRTIGLAEWQYF
jgi:hypothetical protein